MMLFFQLITRWFGVGMLYCACMVSFPLFGQVYENFLDENITHNPVWTGDVGDFRITSSSAIPLEQKPALQLYSEGADTSILVLESGFSGSLQWEFWVKLSFNSSSNNHLRVYLMSDRADLTTDVVGYYLRIGGLQDSVTLVRQSGKEHTELITCQYAYTGNSTNQLRFKVLKSDIGMWEVFCDSVGGQALVPCASVQDAWYNGLEFFGLFCKYSSSNATKFYFDDFYVGPLVVDTVPPSIISLHAVGENNLKVSFSEAITQHCSSNPALYRIAGIGYPDSILPGYTPGAVNLYFSTPFEELVSYTLFVSNIEDLMGNVLPGAEEVFNYYRLKRFDVVINEIMADPSPPIGLPNHEYLELFNVSPSDINLTNWVLRMGSSEKILPDVTISSSGFLIITKEENVPEFIDYGEVIGLSSFSLPNSGQQLALIDSTDQIISISSYSDHGYSSDGGVSIEQVDPYYPCAGQNNWKLSTNLLGGTPGKQNSVDEPFSSDPVIESICLLDNKTIEVFFDQMMDSSSLSMINHYQLDNGMGALDKAQPIRPDFNSVTLFLPQPMLDGEVYTLAINSGLLNCIKGPLGVVMQASFGISYEAEYYDVVINEVLFNPIGDGVDFVEIYNRGNKIIDLSELYIASVNENPPEANDTSTRQIDEGCSVLVPGQYLVLTKDPINIAQQYWVNEFSVFQEIISMHNYNNSSGTVILQNSHGENVDLFKYNDDMHYPLLTSHEGVSLEKVHFDLPSSAEGSWHSASETIGFATPGYKNSQFIDPAKVAGPVTLSSAVFSPDGNGFQDVLTIHFDFHKEGLLATLVVFDMGGRLILTLLNQELIGSEGTWAWNGQDKHGEIVSPGAYILYLELFDHNKSLQRIKKVCAVAW